MSATPRPAAPRPVAGQADTGTRTSAGDAGSCATARSYYFNQHGEAVLLRPTSTISAHREAVRFPIDDYSHKGSKVAV